MTILLILIAFVAGYVLGAKHGQHGATAAINRAMQRLFGSDKV